MMFEEIYALIALLFGLFFLLVYALKYYTSIGIILFSSHNNVNHNNLKNSINHKNNASNNNNYKLPEHAPLVSIHLPFYNETNVAQRILEACLSLDYPNYEIVVIDDSNDETFEIIKQLQASPLMEIAKNNGNPAGHELGERMKVIHRGQREGYKGGALKEALKHTNLKAEYVMVFDADFIPPKNIIPQFLAYFNNYNNHPMNNQPSNDEELVVAAVNQWRKRREIAAVQGYQLHTLNSSENWITRGIRAEYSGN